VTALRKAPNNWVLLGALFFLVSDTHIALNHFWLPAPLSAVHFSGIITYQLAQ
jgi:hypothetical protein